VDERPRQDDDRYEMSGDEHLDDPLFTAGDREDEGEGGAAPGTHGEGRLDPWLGAAPGGGLWGLQEQGEAREPPARGDRWAHRRGEPRTFALLWSAYLLLSAILTVFAAPILGQSGADAYLAPARALLALAAVGSTILWPMTRLSQAPPRRPARAALVDWFVLALLMQAVIWPLTILPGGALARPLPWPALWPWEVSAGVSLLLMGWTALIGGVVAMGTRGPAGASRSGWMALCIVLALAAPITMAAGGWLHLPVSSDWMLGSPVTAMYVLTWAPGGHWATLSGVEWIAAGAPWIAAGVVWLIAAAVCRGRGVRE